MKNYAPVYTITSKITSLVYQIAQDLERINIIREQVLTPHLRRENRIKTIRKHHQSELLRWPYLLMAGRMVQTHMEYHGSR